MPTWPFCSSSFLVHVSPTQELRITYLLKIKPLPSDATDWEGSGFLLYYARRKWPVLAFSRSGQFSWIMCLFSLFCLTTRTSLSAIWSRKELQLLPSNWYPTVLYFCVRYVKTWERLSPKTLRRWVLDVSSQNRPGFITVQLRKMISASQVLGIAF